MNPRIHVPSGTQPVHSFDLWGVIVVQSVLGPRVLDAYQRLREGNEDPESIAEKVRNYQGVLAGDKTALQNKKANVDAVEDPLWAAYRRDEIDVDFDGAIYEDALATMDDIVQAREGLCITTTGNSPWVRQALASLNPLVGERLGKTYSGNKAQPEVFESTFADLASQGQQMISHTEDQMKGLAGLLNCSIREGVNIVYVERTNLTTEEEVRQAGVDVYTRDLRDVQYTQR